MIMKRLVLLGSLLMAIVIGFTACSDNDVMFQFDANGRCYMPELKSISHAEFLKYAGGNGWKHVSTYEINEDGSVQNKEYWEDRVGGSPNKYYFEEDFYISYFFMDAYPAHVYKSYSYDYQEDGNQIGWIDNSGSFFAELQVLSINENKLRVIEFLGVRGGNVSLKRIYGLVTYSKMTAEELEKCRNSYGDINDLEW